MGRKNLPKSKIDLLYVRDGGICWICGEFGAAILFNRDHLIPKSLGGSDGMWNLRIAHISCNIKRDRMAPPLDIVLQYCLDDGMARRAKRMYYRAYPHLKTGDGKVVKRKKAKTRMASVTPGPSGHKKYASYVCGFCMAWCGTCKACWCTASDNDHDVLRIRAGSNEMGVNPSP